MSQIKLLCSDGEIVEVDVKIASKQSSTLNTMIDDFAWKEGDIIPLPNVKSEIAAKIITYLIHHKDDPPFDDETSRNLSHETSSWDADFINVDLNMLFELIKAAEYLKVNRLLFLGCKTVAGMIVRKTPEEIRQKFHIENDFTPEEEEQTRRQNEWVMNSYE